jgi:hypothetical protein
MSLCPCVVLCCVVLCCVVLCCVVAGKERVSVIEQVYVYVPQHISKTVMI